MLAGFDDLMKGKKQKKQARTSLHGRYIGAL